ncbi:hypothetical protein L5515_009945 [Caenorhabditis briggsae]|uniref:Serpentine receptor class gamma n=1 Tax=Caenorhabditis briggsae TaxID=6238 RepID=A0AAE9F4S5_CAEBR|nr:hypothetical protein L5515_009945 [Caenorhabditis briggsae]
MVFTWVFSIHGLLLQLSLYCDMVLNYLPILMLYPLTANQMIGRLYKAIWRRMFTRIRIVAVIIICLTLSCIASVIFIHTAEVRRHFVKKIGFMDSGIDGHQILINRIFYMFPFGSMVCFMVMFVHIHFRKMSEDNVSSRFDKERSKLVFYQLLLTSLIIGIICVGTEFFVIIKPSTYINYNQLHWS